MAINKDKIDDAAMALLYIPCTTTTARGKAPIWGVRGRLHEKGMILDPVGKVKSVVFTNKDWSGRRNCSRKCSRNRRRGSGMGRAEAKPSGRANPPFETRMSGAICGTV